MADLCWENGQLHTNKLNSLEMAMERERDIYIIIYIYAYILYIFLFIHHTIPHLGSPHLT